LVNNLNYSRGVNNYDTKNRFQDNKISAADKDVRTNIIIEKLVNYAVSKVN